MNAQLQRSSDLLVWWHVALLWMLRRAGPVRIAIALTVIPKAVEVRIMRSAYSNGLVRSSGLPRYYVVRDSLADRTLYSGRTVDEMAREAARDEFERLERRSAEEGTGKRTLSDTVMAALVERLVAKLLAGSGAVRAPGRSERYRSSRPIAGRSAQAADGKPGRGS